MDETTNPAVITEIPPEFSAFPKIPRLSRDVFVTEKIDGTCSGIIITETGGFFVTSKNRYIVPGDDNYGFAAWAHEHKDELMQLGVGRHHGEWWGSGLQRRYNMTAERRWSLFNVAQWHKEGTPGLRVEGTIEVPACCHVVPLLYVGPNDTAKIDEVILDLRIRGSVAAPGYMGPEGIIVWHSASRTYFKKTLVDDEKPKSERAKRIVGHVPNRLKAVSP